MKLANIIAILTVLVTANTSAASTTTTVKNEGTIRWKKILNEQEKYPSPVEKFKMDDRPKLRSRYISSQQKNK